MNEQLEVERGLTLLSRTGVNTGEVVAGDPSRGQTLVTGDAVNVAARLEQAAEPGEVLLGALTYRLVRDAVEAEDVGPVQLKGRSKPVLARRLLGLRPDDQRLARRLDPPLVGREGELGTLATTFERAVAEQRCELVTVLGMPGVGKSRLARELLTELGPRASVLSGRCLPYGEGITFWPISEIVRAAALIPRSCSADEAQAAIRALLPDGEHTAIVADRVVALLAYDRPSADLGETFWAVRRLLQAIARRRPLILLLDDVHWAEHALLDLVEYLTDFVVEAPILLLCLSRPELLDARSGWGVDRPNSSNVALEGLSEIESHRVLVGLLDGADLDRGVEERIIDAARGNPLFLEQMLGMLIDEGHLRRESALWVPTTRPSTLPIPANVMALLAARLEQLSVDERAVIERASVVGELFYWGAVADLMPEDRVAEVGACLMALVRRGLIRVAKTDLVDEDALRFQHILIRDAAYRAVPKELRAELHERFAGWLKHRGGDRIAESEEILAHHLEQAWRNRVELGSVDERTLELARTAVGHLFSAADRADDRGDWRAARALLERGARMAEGAERARAMVLLARACHMLGEYAEALSLTEQAISLCRQVGERSWELRARFARIGAREQTDPDLSLAETVREVQAVAAETEALGDHEGSVDALLYLGLLAFFQGDCTRYRRIGELLAPRAEHLSFGNRMGVATAIEVSASVGPTPVHEGFELVDRVRDILGGTMIGELMAIQLQMVLLAMSGRFEESRAEADRGHAIVNELGAVIPSMSWSQSVAYTERLAGRYKEAERLLRDPYVFFARAGETSFGSGFAGLLACVLADEGRFHEAEEFATTCRQLGARDDPGSQAIWRLAQARVLASRGEHDVSLVLAEEAVKITEPMDYIDLRGECHAVRGTLLLAADHPAAAAESLRNALELYERKGNVVMAGRVRDQLAALGSI